MGGVSGLPGPTDAWLTLAALARDTSRVRLGTLVTSATFRLPGPLAISVAQVDQMSGGRVELGLGAGWFEKEHAAYGIPFPSTVQRFDRFEEQLAIITGLWSTPVNETFSFGGEHYTLTGSPALPKPVQSPPPIIIGGQGKKRTPALAARFATEFNVVFQPVDVMTRQFRRVADACEDIDRDPSGMVWSTGLVLCCGETEDEFRRRAAAIGREPALTGVATHLSSTLVASRNPASAFASCQVSSSTSRRGAMMVTCTPPACQRCRCDQMGHDGSSSASAASPAMWTRTAVTPADCVLTSRAVVIALLSNTVAGPKT